MKRAVLILAGLMLVAADPAAAQFRRGEITQERNPPRGSSQERDQRADRPREAPAGPRLRPPQVWSIIARVTPGEQLDTSLSNDGRAIYFVRWRTNDGRRIDYVVDGNSGAILSRNGG